MVLARGGGAATTAGAARGLAQSSRTMTRKLRSSLYPRCIYGISGGSLEGEGRKRGKGKRKPRPTLPPKWSARLRFESRMERYAPQISQTRSFWWPQAPEVSASCSASPLRIPAPPSSLLVQSQYQSRRVGCPPFHNLFPSDPYLTSLSTVHSRPEECRPPDPPKYPPSVRCTMDKGAPRAGSRVKGAIDDGVVWQDRGGGEEGP